MLCLGWNESAKEIYSIFVEILLNFRCKGTTFLQTCKQKSHLGAFFLGMGTTLLEPILRKSTFCWRRVLSVFLRSSLGVLSVKPGKVQERYKGTES